jgi:hypothetical protein
MTRARRVAFALLPLLFVLGTWEALARRSPALGPPEMGIVMPAHPTRGWTLRTPSSADPLYRADADGLRVSAAPGDPAAPLILTTGDSSIFGDGLPDGDTLHDRLQASLEAAGAPARVRTLGVPGYSTIQTRVVLDEVGWDLGPRLLIIGNLWSDSTLERLRDADLLRAARSPLGRAEFWLSHSALFVQLRARLNAARGLPATRKVTWPTPGATGVRRVPIADYAGHLAALLMAARERGVGVIVLALANDQTLLPGGDRRAGPWSPYFDVQARTAAAFGVPVVRAVDALAGKQPNEVLRDNLHPNEAGAALIADALAAAVLAAGWPSAVPVPATGATAVAPPVDDWEGREKFNSRSVVEHALESNP